MSAQYKLKKYMSKLETAMSLDKVDLYLGKIRKYKMTQNGGAEEWDADVGHTIAKLKEAKDKISQKIEISGEEVDKVVDDIKMLKSNTVRTKEALQSALEGLDALMKESEIAMPEKVVTDILAPFIRAIGEPRPVIEIKPAEMWGNIRGKQVPPPLPPRPPSRPLSPAVKEAQDIIPKGKTETEAEQFKRLERNWKR